MGSPSRAWPVLLLTACLSAACTSKEAILPQDGPTMHDIYRHHFAHSGGTLAGTLAGGTMAGGTMAGIGLADDGGVIDPVAALRLDLADAAAAGRPVDLAGYTRSAAAETRQLFPRLPNPDVVLYVFPHLAGPERLPVPGYATAFPLYERTEYALPGDLVIPEPAIAPMPPWPLRQAPGWREAGSRPSGVGAGAPVPVMAPARVIGAGG